MGDLGAAGDNGRSRLARARNRGGRAQDKGHDRLGRGIAQGILGPGQMAARDMAGFMGHDPDHLIGVVRGDGAPTIELTGRAQEVAKEAGIEEWRLSLSHTAGIAIASVIGFGG